MNIKYFFFLLLDTCLHLLSTQRETQKRTSENRSITHVVHHKINVFD